MASDSGSQSRDGILQDAGLTVKILFDWETVGHRGSHGHRMARGSTGRRKSVQPLRRYGRENSGDRCQGDPLLWPRLTARDGEKTAREQRDSTSPTTMNPFRGPRLHPQVG